MTKAEQEVVISKCADETEWTVYCTDTAALPFWLRLAEKVNGRVVEHQGGTKFFLPQESVCMRAKRKLHLSPERRAVLAARMRKLHSTVAGETRPSDRYVWYNISTERIGGGFTQCPRTARGRRNGRQAQNNAPTLSRTPSGS